jgi:hypothetical protein
MASLACAALALPACKPNLVGRPSGVDGPRLLAIRSIPAEKKVVLGTVATVDYEALYVDATGDLDATTLDWAFCNVRKPLADTGAINAACLEPRSRDLTPITGTNVELGDAGADSGTDGGAPPAGRVVVSAPLDKNVCSNFGPSPPIQKPGEPPSRPPDPDITGGYYQPLRIRFEVDGADQYSVGVTRIDCGVGGDIGSDYNKRYHPNENPSFASLTVGVAGTPQPVANGATIAAKPGDALAFAGEWTKCEDTSQPTTKPCGGSEPYVVVDSTGQALLDRREAIRVSWFATDGAFDHDTTGRTQEESIAGANTTDNTWTAPATKGVVHMWIVIRDDRGGVGWSEVKVDVEP